ncbi:MAG: tetratricopeptide repeat protein [Spirochaetaceae bacterium]
MATRSPRPTSFWSPASGEALSAGDPDQARVLFDDALLLSLPGERPEAAFYLGYTYHLLGEMRRALEHLRMIPPDPESRY